MFLMTDIVAAFAFSAKRQTNKQNKTKQNKKSQMEQVHWKTILVYLVNSPILNTAQIISTLSFMLMLDMGLFVFPHFKLWKL